MDEGTGIVRFALCGGVDKAGVHTRTHVYIYTHTRIRKDVIGIPRFNTTT